MKRWWAILLVVSILSASKGSAWIDLLPPFPQSLPIEQQHEQNPPLLKPPPKELSALGKEAALAEQDYTKALEYYDRAVERYGLRSRQAQVAASDLEAAFSAYSQAAGR